MNTIYLVVKTLFFQESIEYKNYDEVHKLTIRNISTKDSGNYKCEIDTSPKMDQVITFFYTLKKI